MDQKLQEKLFKEFPKLYRQQNMSMRETCMCWGICVGDGWYHTIFDLSKKLEYLIDQELLLSPLICFCGCEQSEHKNLMHECTHVFHDSYRIGGYYGYAVPDSKIKHACLEIRRRILSKTNKFLEWITPVINKSIPCECKEFKKTHASASQVKEKFGTLRFYMDGATDEMYDAINEAERLSATTCESCGLPGKVIGGGWIRVLCDKCNKEDIK